MKTILEIIHLSTEYLKKRGIECPRRQAEELISDALNMQRMQLYLEFDRPLIEQELEKCRQYLERRGKKEPLQYIHGKVQFLDCKIQVNPSVLIPRQETEILVEKIIQQILREDSKDKVLWDVCCGSGCIGIAIKKKLPHVRVLLSDISAEAIQIAKGNAILNQCEVEILQGDLLEPFAGQQTDYLVCNPPYIAIHEFSTLEQEVRDHEPYQALIAGQTGLEFYKKLATELLPSLRPQAKVWLEMGKGQGSAVKELFLSCPNSQSRIELDWAGHDRFFFLEME